MSLPSKEKKVLELFFNQPSKHWHFEEILKASKVSRSKANKWLAKFVREKIILHTKPQNKMPYFQGFFESPAYKNLKKLYTLSKLYESGFLNHLLNLQKAKAIILFGSFSRSDWYAESDVDLFIYGDDEGLDLTKYQHNLNREIQVFTAQNVTDLNTLGPALLRNILEGMLIKGSLDFIKVIPNATTT